MIERKKKTILFLKDDNPHSEITTLIEDRMKSEPPSYKNSTNSLETPNKTQSQSNKPNLI